MPEPAKIEFLTRGAGSGGFQTRQVESGEAQRLFRPRRLSESAWELTPQPRSPDGKHFVLRNRESDRYVLLDSQEHFLWEHFDGEHTLGDIARLFHFEFGAFDYGIITHLLARLYAAGLLQEAGAAGVQPSPGAGSARRLARALLRWRRLCTRISLKLAGADDYCAAIYRRGGFLLFNGFALALCLALAAYALTAVYRLWPQAKEITLGVAAAPALSTAGVILVTVVVAILHVLVHALACKAYGRKVREIGFYLMQGVLPTFYADVTDIFMASRRARIVVDLAGPLVEVFFGSVAFIAAYWSEPGLERSIFFVCGVLLWEGALLNLYPFNFFEFDGYNILADLLAMPMLRQRALALFPKLPRRLLRGPRLGKSEWIQTGYLAVCFLSALVYLVLHLDAVGLGWLIRPN